MHEREWAELGKIDYFLEQLARAVERGSVPRASYDELAPHYLERRAELAEVLERAAVRAPAEAIPQPARAVEVPAGVPQARPAGAVLPPVPARAIAPPAPKASTPLSWTTVLIATGAFLVIVAAAVFAIAAWQMVSPGLRLLFLGALTFGFYAAGNRVRTRLSLETGGIALTVVGSAMLLFDGWILIDGYHLTGPLPFAGWLLVCSVVYWMTEIQLQRGYFGITGAAAQVAWWWLLGEGLGWAVEPRLAAISVVLATWVIASRRVEDDSPFDSLARMLRIAAPVGAVLVVWTFMGQFGFGGVIAFISAVIVGVSISVIVELLDFASVIGAAGYLPLLLLATRNPLDRWWQVALFAVLAVAHISMELRRGGIAYGVLGLLSMIAALFSLGGVLALHSHTLTAAFIVLALAWSAIGYGMRRSTIAEERRAGRLGVLALIFEFGGWAMLAVVSVATLFVTRAFPLIGDAASYSDAALVLFAAAAILAASVLHRRPATAAALFMTLYGSWVLLDSAVPTLVAPLRAVALIGVAGVWYLMGGALERATEFDSGLLRMLARASAVALLAVALGFDAWFAGLPTWQSAVLLGAVALWFLADGVLGRLPASFGVAGGAATAAVAMWGGWHTGGALAGMAASATALVIATAGVMLRRVRGAALWVPWAAIAVATVVAPFAWHDPAALTFTFALCALAAVAAAFSSMWIEGVFIAGLFIVGATLAALANAAVTAWTTTGVMIGLAAVLLAPSFFADTDAKSVVGRSVRAIAGAGLVAIVVLIMLGMNHLDISFGSPRWIALDINALALAVAALGAYVIAGSVAFSLSSGFYVGVLFFLCAYWLKLGDVGGVTIEFFTVPASVYVAWCGYRYKRLHPDTAFPVASDLGAVALLLFPPVLALSDPTVVASVAWQHTVWAIGLALGAIALGVVLRVRAYFLGGVAALVYTAFVRSWTYLVEYWWVVLGVVGIGMIVVALARELRRQMLTGVRDVLEGWR